MAEISYIKTDWVDNETKLNAYNMNHIENGIVALDTALGNKLDKSDVVQTTGQSTTEVMSQKAVTDELNKKANKSDLDNTTEELNKKANKADLEQTSAKLDALWKLNEGISYDFLTVNASKYENDIPSGAKKAAIEMIGGYNKQVGDREFVNADVTSVKVRGTNMFDEDLLLTATGWTKENGVYKGRANFIYNPNILSSLKFEYNTQYSIGYIATEGTVKNFRINVTYTDNTTERFLSGVSGVTEAGKTVSKMEFGFGNNGTVELSNIIIAKSSVAVDYVPYILNTYPIPEAVRMETDYGWGFYDTGTENDVYNSIERTESGWQYVHRLQYFSNNEYAVLETPGITDITDLMAGFPNNFTVEPYGTITFVNSSGVNMPNTIKYLRALAEVK